MNGSFQQIILNGYQPNGIPTTPPPSNYHSPQPGSSLLELHMTRPIAGGSGRNILRTALTNPAEIAQLRMNAVSSSQDYKMDVKYCTSLIEQLIKFENTNDVHMTQGFSLIIDNQQEWVQKIDDMNQAFALKLTEYLRHTPFTEKVAIDTTAQVVASSWLSVATLCATATQAMNSDTKYYVDIHEELMNEANKNEMKCTKLFRRVRRLPDLELPDINSARFFIEQISKITVAFRRLKLQLDEFVCMKTLILLQAFTQVVDEHLAKDFRRFQDIYVDVLATFCRGQYPSQPDRAQKLLVKIKEITRVSEELRRNNHVFFLSTFIAFPDHEHD